MKGLVVDAKDMQGLQTGNFSVDAGVCIKPDRVSLGVCCAIAPVHPFAMGACARPAAVDLPLRQATANRTSTLRRGAKTTAPHR